MQENPNPRPPEEPSPGQPEAGRKRAFSPVFFGFALAILILSGLLFWGSALLRPSGPDPVSAPPANNRPVSSSSSVSAEESTPPAARRLLGIWEGKLALFTEGRESPDEVYDVYVQTLPKEEQDRLRQGIAVGSEEELAGWLEDYTS